MFIMTRKSLEKFKFNVKLSHLFVVILNPQLVYLIYENIMNIIFFLRNII